MKNIVENISTEVRAEYDVAVAGGGIAGIAAALSAAREGARVVLLERGFILGGLATAGLVTIYLPLCDGEGNQVSFGIAEELLRLSIKHGAEARYPAAWLEGGTHEQRCRKRFEVQYNPWIFAIEAERLLLDAGVTILYGTTVTAVHKEEGRISALILEGKTDRYAIEVKNCVVDATGDADVCYLAGARTSVYSGGNGIAAWYYAAGYKEDEHRAGLKQLGVLENAEGRGGSVIREGKYKGFITDEIPAFMYDSHALTLKDILARRESGEPELVPTSIASIPQLRMTRRLVGHYDLHDDEIGKEFPDSVGMCSDWRYRGPVYEIPFRTLWGEDVRNLLVAGRCISVTDEMWDITRVVPVCAVTGEAAGVAAAMTDDLETLDIKALRSTLEQRGVKLHKRAKM